MISNETKNQTIKDWQDLGFYYDLNEEARVWFFIGSKNGLRKFTKLLKKYTSNPENKKISEHDHYGPYMYLKVMTWAESGIDENGIFGKLSDLKELGKLIEYKLENANEGTEFIIKNEYSENAEFSLHFFVKEDGFDPASIDPALS